MQLIAEQVGENYSQAIDEKLDWMSECIPLLYESGESKTYFIPCIFYKATIEPRSKVTCD